MKKNIKQCISGLLVAVIMLTSAPLKIVLGAEEENKRSQEIILETNEQHLQKPDGPEYTYQEQSNSNAQIEILSENSDNTVEQKNEDVEDNILNASNFIQETNGYAETASETNNKARSIYALSYHVGAYDIFTETDGSCFVTIDGTKYYYSDDFDPGNIANKLPQLENQNVVYELHENEIVRVYTMDNVLHPIIKSETDVKDGIIYRNGKFSQKSFGLMIKISIGLQEDFAKNDLLWFLSDAEKSRLYSSIKKLEIKPSDDVDFGSSGWWMWKDYEKEISSTMNEQIKVGETKEYNYTVNLHNVMNQAEYNISLYITPTFDIGTSTRIEDKIKIGNLDYQEENTKKKKETSNSGKAVNEAATELEGIQTAIQFSNNYFTSNQIKSINEFVNTWIAELILAKYVDKSELKEKVSEKIANEWLKKLGLDTSVLPILGTIRATTYLKTQTTNGTKVFIQFNINLTDIDFGNQGIPTMATGTGNATVYNMDGTKLDSSVILPAYANVCSFCQQLQKVAKNTIFNGAKTYLSLFGENANAESTAEALSSKMMGTILNCKYTKSIFKRVDAKDVKEVLKKIIIEGEKQCNQKIFELITTPTQESTQISVKCPVDVKVYDNDGNLCGKVTDNIVDSEYNDIFVNVVGDQKNIYLVGDDYSFELAGTDEGSMDYVVREFDETGNTTREITYEGVKLSNGCKYYSYVPEAENHSSTLFDLTDSDGNIISPTTGADEETSGDNPDTPIASGKCGDDVFWKFYDDGLLRIYGNGEIISYNYSGENQPWRQYSDQIASLVIENGITHIGSASFIKTSLSSVELPDTLTSIGSSAFRMCTNLSSIELPDSLTSIDNNAFRGCTSLGSVEFPDNLSTIGGGTFCGCINLSSVELPDSLTSIDDNTFGSCTSLSNIEFPDNLSTMGEDAFSYCTSLSSVELPNSLTSIGNNAFRDCTNLSSVELPDSLTSIGNNAFRDCTNLSSVELSDDLTSMSLNSIVFSGVLTSIGEYAFYGCTNLNSVELPDNLTSIGFRSFNDCTNLSNIKFPDNLTSIGRQAFYGCTNLNSVELPDNLTSIGSYAFCNCTNLSNIKFPDNLTSIGEQAFSSCTSLSSVELPDNLTSIGSNIFRNCTSLSNVKFPNNLTTIEGAACYNCTSLSNIEFPNNLTTIGSYAFSGCTSLSSVELPDNLTSIGSYAFDNCTNLKKIVILSKTCEFAYSWIGHGYFVPSEVIIYGYLDSTVQRYVEKCGGKFIALDGDFTDIPDITPTNTPSVTPTDSPKQPQKMTVTPGSLELYVGGNTKQLKVSNAKGKVTYNNSNPKVIKINSKGKVTPLSKGKATITVTAAGDATYETASKKINVTVYGKPAKVKSVKAVPGKSKRTLKVSWKKVSSVSGYIIKYSYNKNMKNSKTIKVNGGNNTSKTIKKLTSKKYVYIQMQAYKKDGNTQIKGTWSTKTKSKGKIK